MFGSISPDFDMILVLALPAGLALHHGPTHSLLGATCLGLATALVFRLRKPSSIAVVGLATLLHVPLDALTGNAAEAAEFGVPIWWPFRDSKWISEHALFIPFGIDGEGFLWNMVSGAAWRAYGIEAAFVAAIWGVVLLVRALVPQRAVATTAVKGADDRPKSE
jgi:membrane-bound metal-dependent hydrolase YbcI (DUF457 family)